VPAQGAGIAQRAGEAPRLPSTADPAPPRERRPALVLAAAAALATTVVLALAVALPRGRARSWRPGRHLPPVGTG
jgi:hypothetical protein